MDTAAELENARALCRLGRHKAAAEICQKVLDRQPNRADALLVLGAIADALNDSRSAIGFLTRIVDREPEHPGAAVLLAGVLAKLGAADGAVAWYRVALELDHDAPHAAPALARLLATAGRFDEVAALATQELAKDRLDAARDVTGIGRSAAPTHAGLALAFGQVLIATGKPAQARPVLKAATAERPQDPVALTLLARALKGDPDWLSRSLALGRSRDLEAEFADALAQRGDTGEALRRFEAVLAAERDHRMALDGLARLHLVRGEADAAVGLARRRLAADPDDTDAARVLGEALARRGLASSAMTFAQSAAKAGREPVMRAVAAGVIVADPDRLDAWRMLGTVRAFRVALGRDPTDTEAMAGLAAASPDDIALTWLERAIRLDDRPPIVLALARALGRAGAADAARQLVRPLLATLNLRRAGFATELADVLIEVGEVEPAIRLLDTMASADPEDADVGRRLVDAQARRGDRSALVHLGQAHLERQRPALAAMALGAARKIRPDNAQIAFLHGQALREDGQKTAAIDAYADAAETAGDENLDLVNRAGEALVSLQAADLGLRYLRRVVERDFANPDRHGYSYFFNFLNQCDWPARQDYVERLTALAEAKIAADDPDFRLNPSLWVFLAAERDLLYRSANHFARHAFPAAPPPTPPTGANPDRPIRLGYISAYLYGHHIGYSLTGILRGHDRRQVQIHLYSLTRDDPVQAALKGEAQVFRSIDGKSPAAIAQMIAGDGIDVLVDLDGYVNSGSGLLTLKIASHRPAPIQMLYHNYVGPTGTSFVDYVVADRELLDAHDDAGYRERLIRLPPCYYPAVPLPTARARTDRRAWGLPEDGAVFCNFGHFYKVEPRSFDVWMRILRRVPGSVLWMNHWDTPKAVANLRREADARGVDPNRLVFSALAEKPIHLSRLGLADLFLDTFVYASGVTSLDALWGGVPVLTVRGSTFARRVGASLNAGIGLEDMTCADVPAFEELAVALATDRARLAAIKARLAANLATHTLFDPGRLAGKLERAYRAAFRRYLSGQPPESFELQP